MNYEQAAFGPTHNETHKLADKLALWAFATPNGPFAYEATIMRDGSTFIINGYRDGRAYQITLSSITTTGAAIMPRLATHERQST